MHSTTGYREPKWLKIKEMVTQGATERNIQKEVAEEFGSCSTSTIFKVKKRLKTLESETIDRIERDTGVDRDDMGLTWIKVPATDGQPGYSMSFKPPKGDAIDYCEKFENLLSTVGDLSIKLPNVKANDKCLIAILSDIHVGLDGKGQYNYQYGKDQLTASIHKFIQSIKDKVALHGAFDKIVLLDLGDGLDGWNGQTTRGGHSLQQNMSNSEQFDCYVEIKLMIIKSLLEMGLCKSLAIRTVTCDNHAGQFSVIANMAIEKVCKVMNSDINVSSYTQFMHHFIYGNNCFLVTHGKDDKHQKYGLPLQINDKAINHINNYITVHGLQKYNCHVLKGDLHSNAHQDTKYFSYHNFGSLAVPSGWVQANFGDGSSSYSLLIVDKDSRDVERYNKFVEYKKELIKDDFL